MDKTIGNDVTIRPKAERGTEAFTPGDVIAGRYVVEKVLGEGGMGIVYQCLDKVGGVSVAVKCLPPEVSRNEDEMEDIRANYRLVADLHHPNIAGARTLELDGSTGDYYLVMDLAAGTTLKRWARRHADAGIDAKFAILRQVAAALDYAHAEKVIHRDVKPENVMVDDDGRVKVLDFGLAAQIRSSQSRTSNTVTSKGGTPGYKSPEQWLGRPQQAPADVYAFGVMAYWLFSGHLPFDGDDPVVLGHAVLSAPVEPIPDLSAHMNAALAKALAKKPEDRFASCGAFVDALEGNVFSRGEHVERVDGAVGSRDLVLRSFSEGGPRDRPGGSRSRATAILLAALAIAVAGGWWYVNARSTGTTDVPSVATNAATGTTGVPPVVTEADVTEIVVEATVQKARMERLDDADGFKARKDALADILVRATANGKAKRWGDAALGFTNYVNECKALFALDVERHAAKKSQAEAEAAKNCASEAEALQYAETRWNAAIGFLEAANDLFGKMMFADATSKYAAAAKQFDICVPDAKAEKKRLEDAAAAKAQAEKEAAEAAAAKARAEEQAKKLKAEAESHLVPTLRVVAKIGGTEVSGAKVKAGGKIFTTPFVWKLNEGSRYGPYAVSYESGDKRYYGTIDVVTVDWHGSKSMSVALEEYVEPPPYPYEGQTREYIVKGGDSLGKIAYENKISIRALKELNGLTIDNVRVGMRLKIPVARQTVATVGRMEEVREPKTGDTKIITLPGGATMEMIYVAPGTFTMGSPPSEKGRHDDEKQHQVTLTKGFWLGKYEVTQAQWQSVMGENPSKFKGDKRPVENVSWEDCQSFIRRINSQQNCGVRLPTEAEWEYACRAGSVGPYGGNGNLDDMGWYWQRTWRRGSVSKTHPVGQTQANAWGFYDMHGNVYEWCDDWYGDYGSATTDPAGPASGVDRVLRGGSWYTFEQFCRSANRNRKNPDHRDHGMGLRLCCSAGPRE